MEAVDRRSSDLENQQFDLVIVGGGIYGICAAREAALQGLSVCLLEKDDFGASTSSNSLKIIHGGLRYLQNLDIRRMRESIRERRAMLRLAPHLVRPMPFAIPCYGHWLRGREVMAGALVANAVVSADRNVGVMPENRLPAGHLLSRKRLEELIPELPEPGCVGGAVWYDGQATNTERLAVAFLEAAQASGARLFNHVRVTGFLKSGDRVVGVEATDELSQEAIRIRSRLVLNAAGPWVDELLDSLPGGARRQYFTPSKAMNLVTRRLFSDHAAAIPFLAGYDDAQAVFDKKSLHFFVVPWKAYSLIGTRHLPWSGRPDDFRIERRDVERFLAEINEAYPAARLTLADVHRVYGGVLPALPPETGSDVQIAKQYTLVDHETADGVPGLITMLGVKWTTARDVAEQAIRVALKKLGKRPVCDTSRALPPSARYASWQGLLSGLSGIGAGRYDDALLERLAESHGANAVALLESAVADERLGAVIETDDAALPVLAAEVETAVRSEWARGLDDIVLRRTEIAIGGHPGTAALEAIARIAATAAGWDKQNIHAQIDRTESALDRLTV